MLRPRARAHEPHEIMIRADGQANIYARVGLALFGSGWFTG